MPTFSDPLLQVARQLESTLDTSVAGALEALCLPLLASALCDALESELATTESADARLVLETAIARCRGAAGAGHERRRRELIAVAAILSGAVQLAQVPVPRPRFRVIAGGLA